MSVMRSVLMVLLLLAAGAHSQPMDSAVARVLVIRIVSQFNAGQCTAFYTLADSGFKANVREEDIVGLLNSAASLGKIQRHGCVGTEEGGLTYRLHFAKRSLLMDISPVSDSMFCRFGLRPYRLAPVRDRDDCRHDNLMQSRLDSVVQQAAMAYMINRHVAGLSVGVLSGGEMHLYNFASLRYFKRSLERVQKAEGRIGTQYEMQINQLTGFKVWFQHGAPADERADSVWAFVQKYRKPIVIQNLIPILWVGTRSEIEQALAVLREETGLGFKTAKEWASWWENKSAD